MTTQDDDQQGYHYESLPHTESIRLLQLEPGEDEQDLECRLIVVNIHEAPPYEAISYEWGDASNKTNIKCDGRSLPITVNLAVALKHFRRHHPETLGARVLWADAICINQQDVLERNQQVSLMGLVFSKAARVLAWIGPDRGYAETAFTLIEEVIQLFEDQWSEDKIIWDLPEFDGEHSLLHDPSQWGAIQVLSACSYFKRVWVQQELGLSKSAVIVWGGYEISWNTVGKFAVYMIMKGRITEDRFGIRYDTLHRTYCFYKSKSQLIQFIFRAKFAQHDPKLLLLEGLFYGDFWELLYSARGYKATDHRDIIYAFLAHPTTQSSRSGGLIVQPDYTRTVEELFKEVTVAAFTEQRSLQVLSFVQHEADRPISSPSWVPDFYHRTGALPFLSLKHPYQATTGLKMAISINQRQGIIKLRGLLFDSIADVTAAIKQRNFEVVVKPEAGKRIHILHQTQAFVRAAGVPDTKANELLSLVVVAGTVRGELAQECVTNHRANFYAYCAQFGLLQSLFESEEPDMVVDIQHSLHMGDALQFREDAKFACNNRRVFRTQNGALGLGPQIMQRGDLVCFIFGAHTPFILRREDQHYIFIGDCYLHAYMQGEILEERFRSETKEMEFEIH